MSDEAILFANNLSYKTPMPTSVTVDRVLKRQYFQNTRYEQNQTGVCVFNTGTDFVDSKNSALVMRVKVNGTANFECSWGSGSGANVLRNMRIYHRTGVCYSNVQRLNLWRKTTDRYVESGNWFDTVGSLMGYNQTANAISNIVAGGDEITVVIPLDHVHPFFNPESKVFLPSQMASGLRVEIDFANFAEALVEDTGSVGEVTSYSIEEIYFETMNVTLQDSAQASLNTVSAKQALEYIYKDIFTSQNTAPSLTTAVNIDINKAVSFADHVFAVVQDTASLNSVILDSFDADYRGAQWQYILGSNYYPSNVKVSDDRVAYKNALIAYDKLKHNDKPTDVRLQDFNTTEGIYAVSLERDTALALSQSPINNSRSLRFEVSFTTPPAEEITTTIFLSYLTSSRATLTSARIDI
jgi:hypothetical protein